MNQQDLLSEKTPEDQAEMLMDSEETATDQAETPRNYWLVVWRGLGAGGAECVAKTADYSLVRAVTNGLHTNYLLEDDDQDCMFDLEFVRTAPAVAAGLTRKIRQAACHEWPAEVNAEISSTEA